jgi:beta-glucanase (GH16 family)
VGQPGSARAGLFWQHAVSKSILVSRGETAAEWHVYSVDWSDSAMVFKVNDKEVYRVTKAMVEKHGRWAFDNSKFVIADFALGGRPTNS